VVRALGEGKRLKKKKDPGGKGGGHSLKTWGKWYGIVSHSSSGRRTRGGGSTNSRDRDGALNSGRASPAWKKPGAREGVLGNLL